MKDLSVIIVSYKGWERLVKCLESLDAFIGKRNAEVIVVDNKSGGNSLREIEQKFSGFKFIYNDVNGGFANGCNIGGSNASGEYLLFLNPDTVVTESNVEKLLVTARQNPSYSVLSCRQVNERGKESRATGVFPEFNNLTGLQRTIFGKKAKSTGLSETIIFPDWVSGSVILMRRGTFMELKGFDEDFWMYFEDVDLCKRVRNKDGIVAFCRNITIEHNHGGSSRINLQTESLTKTEVQISRHVYINKHKNGLERILLQGFLVINNLLTGSVTAVSGLILFFIPKVFVRTLIYFNLLKYYPGSFFKSTWLSPRSVNYPSK